MTDQPVSPVEGAVPAPEITPFSIDAKYIEDGKILGKYDSTVELLEAMAGGTHVADAPAPVALDGAPAAPATDAPGVVDLQVPTLEASPESTGLAQEDLARYEQEAIKGGALSEASLVELEGRGYPREIATAHVQGILAQRELATQKVSSAVGGADVVNSALKWASQNKSEAEVSAINAALSSSDPTTQTLILQGLVRESGAISSAMSGSTAPALTSQPYPSQSQWLSDLKAPAYKSDPAFRAQVMARMRSTEQSGGFKH
jgi:hypothetical protein